MILHSEPQQKEALGRIGDEGAEEPLVALLNDNDVSVSKGMQQGTSGKIGDEKAIETTYRCQKKRKWYVRLQNGRGSQGYSIQKYGKMIYKRCS